MAFLERNANRGSVSTGYDIDYSMKCQANDGNEWFYRNSPTAGNKKTFTFSFWIKRTQLDGYQADNYLMSQGSNARFHFASHTLRFMFDGNSTELEAAGKLRDTAAWYHIVLAVDTTQATNTNRVKAYINGESYPFNNSDWPSQNQESSWMSGTNMYFNTRDGDGSYDNSGYWAEIAVVDGQQLAPTEFGEYNDDGIWIPKDLSNITFGNEGFWWNFSDSSNLGADSSGNSNTATFNNLTTADLATDTPTNNFCTWLSDGTIFNQSTDNDTFSEGGTRYNTRAGTGWTAVYPTQMMAAGKWYMEVKVNETSGTNMYGAMPVKRINSLQYQEYYHGQDTDGSIGLYANNGQIYYGTASSGGTGSALSAGNIVGIAIDMDNYKIYFAVNNTYVESGNPAGNSNGRSLEQEPYVFSIAHYTTTTVEDTNFGGYTAMSNTHTNTDENGYGNFVYAPPSGFLALCTKNLAEYG